MDQAVTVESGNEEITFREFLNDVFRAKVMFAILAAVLTLSGVLFGLFGPKEYKAETVLLPTSEESAASGLGKLSSLASEFGGLASLAGVKLPGMPMESEAVATLQSQLITRRYIGRHDLLPILFASRWNSAANRWKSMDPDDVPTLWLANRYFNNKIRSVVVDKDTGLVTMTIEWKDPAEAAQWTNGLVALTNRYLQNKAIDEAQRNIEYLNDLIAKTDVVQERQVIYALMEQQIDKEMTARGKAEYALKVIDPAFVPRKPSSAGPLLMGLLGFTLALFLGIVVVFVQRAMRA